ncbi:MAG: arabinan endo-1,5-alpha-L-arabinosidase [Sedimentisphaerales bacterium]|nr:arabinan endo-1,5-alpha-L-arabinosidase [Sedimentisphaerales bacterium]
MKEKLFLLVFIIFTLILFADLTLADYEVLTGDYWSHDPVMIKQGNTYYSFCTGRRTPIRKSTDMHYWQYAGDVWPTSDALSWWEQEVPDFADPDENNYNIWAPEIAYFNGKYHLYYSISSWGSNHSCIGLATNTTLDSSNPAYQWVDEGIAIRSYTYNNYNAIDPSLLIDDSGPTTTYWLAFGSFWSGIKLKEIDPATGKPFNTVAPMGIASRGGGAIEAPCLVYRNGYYYLFVSFDACCAGTSSTYNVRYGRATDVTGPYLDEDGISMMYGGGTQITWPDDDWKGPGHNDVLLDDDGRYWLLHHAYAVPSGWAGLRIHELFWTPDGWPSFTEPTCADVHNLGAALPSDWVQDCYVDFHDLLFLAENWSNGYDLQDFADLAEYWLQCNEPSDGNCIMNW